MTPRNILDIRTRDDFRRWLSENHDTAKECWIVAKRGKTPPDDAIWYIDAVEEALCFGWIDSTLKRVDGVALQRFGPRSKSSSWTELNKERCRRLEKLGLMTDAGRAVCPDLDKEFIILPEIIECFKTDPEAWANFTSSPSLYQRVRIDNIQRALSHRALFESRLQKLIEACRQDCLIGDWHDCGRLLDY